MFMTQMRPSYSPQEWAERLHQMNELNQPEPPRMTREQRQAVLRRMRAPRPADPAWATRDEEFDRQYPRSRGASPAERSATLRNARALVAETAAAAPRQRASGRSGKRVSPGRGIVHYAYRNGEPFEVPCPGGDCKHT